MSRDIYKHYLLIVLLFILAFNCVDGLALGLVLQDIKRDLSLSDTQLGLLTGIAFALFYSVMGIPIARWADRGNRVTIIAVTAAAWSVMVALCGLAGSFAQLLLIRVGVGIGEAGVGPPAHSLIADYFTRAERARAMAIYMQGNTLGIVLGYWVAGWLNQWFGWRATFIVLGLVGLVPAALAWLTLREPRSSCARDRSTALISTHAPVAAASSPDASPSLREVCVTLWANTTFRHLLYAFSVVSFFGNGTIQWQPAFFARSYGMNTGVLGAWFTLIYGAGGMIGMYWGGVLASRYAENNERRQLKAMAMLYCISGLLSVLIYVSPNYYWAFGWMALSTVVGSLTSAPLFATIQTLVEPRMRAMSVAVLGLFANLIGLGLGPLTVGALSDALRSAAGEESLRYALIAMSPGTLWVAWHLWRASKTVAGDLEAAQEGRDDPASEENALLNARHITGTSVA